MIKDFLIENVNEISKLINRVFDEFVGINYSKLGQLKFKEFVTPEAILNRFENGNFILINKTDGIIDGVIEVKGNNHISLFFVDSIHQKKGIGKKLMFEVFERINGKTEFITVNSSNYAENIYKKLGFETIDVLQEINGIKFIPMKKFLNSIS